MSALAVIGVSQISACGAGIDALSNALSRGAPQPQNMPIACESGTKDVPVLRADPGGSLADLDVRRIRRMDRLCTFFVSVTQSALSGSHRPAPPSERVGVITATGFGGLASSFKFLDGIIEGGDDCGSPFVFAGAVNNASSTSIARYFDFRGPCLTLVGFDNLIVDALRIASLWLSNGLVDVVVAAFGDEFHPVLAYGLSEGRGWARDGVLRPLRFDQQTFVPGEAFACFVLTSVERNREKPVVSPVATYSELASEYQPFHDEPQFLAAEGNSVCGSVYRQVALRADCNVAYSGCWGGSPTAGAMTLAAALVSVTEGRLWPPCGSEGVESSIRVPTETQKLGSDSVACVMAAENGGGSVVRVSSSVKSARRS